MKIRCLNNFMRGSYEMNIDDLTGEIIGAVIEVHKALDPGLMESVYEECLCHESDLRRIHYKRQRALPVEYKGVK